MTPDLSCRTGPVEWTGGHVYIGTCGDGEDSPWPAKEDE